MYKLWNLRTGVMIERISDHGFFSENPENSDYQEYLKWVAEGNTPAPAEE